MIELKHLETRNFGMANSQTGTDDPLSAAGPITGEFCKPAEATFQITFLVDVSDHPLPRPLPTFSVSALITLETGGGRTPIANFRDPAARYVAPGRSLEPSFPRTIPVTTSVGGTLHVELSIEQTAGPSVTYDDRIPLVVQGCV